MILKIKNYNITIDDEDWDLIKRYNWHLANKKGTIYIMAFDKINDKKVTIQLARVILNAPKGKIVDHINGDTLDNRKHNLRLADKRTNAQNMRSNKNTSSEFKGVCWSKHKNKWRANIFYKKQIHLGYFKSEIDAAIAYNEAAKKFFGEYARLNIITNPITIEI
jgi:hypothetical protein